MDLGKACSFCGLRFPDLQRCSRCKGEWYCSRDCQRKHWKGGHKTTCLTGTDEANEMDEGNECSFCGLRSPDLQRCSRCKGEWYCSRDCQRKHWKGGHKTTCLEKSDEDSYAHSSQKGGRDMSERHKTECKRNDYSRVKTKCENEKVCNKEQDILENKNYVKVCNVCSFCGINGTMKVCQRCSEQGYCSVECQKADWKRHKQNCTKAKKQTQNSKKGNDDTMPICANCKSKSAYLKCLSCSAVFYCSGFCQMSDWNKHKSSCRGTRSQAKIRETLSTAECSMMGLVTPEEHGGKNINDRKDSRITTPGMTPFWTSYCNLCKTGSDNIVCPDCMSVGYCSEKCKELDTEHRKTCIQTFIPFVSRIHSSAIQNRGTDSNGKSVSSLRILSSPTHARLPLKNHPLFVEDGADLNLIIERTARARGKAIDQTQRKFPRHTLLIRIREIPFEERSMLASNICTIPNVFLAYIRRFHDYRGRHSVYLQDSERREIYASFYLPNDDPTPYFQWIDLCPGKFIAILFPRIHFYGDGLVGLRVDEAKHVYCFDVKD